MRDDQYTFEADLGVSHWWWVARRRLLARVMARYLDDHRNYQILEVGCGGGVNIPMLRRFGEVRGLEMSPIASGTCRQRFPDLKIATGTIPTPLEETFDVICLFDVLEHIQDDCGAMHWIESHLNPGGYVFLTVPAFPFLWSPHDEVTHHFRRYTRATLLDVMGKAFSPIYVTYFNTHLFPVIAAVRLARRALGLRGGEADAAMGATGFFNSLLTTLFSAESIWIPRFRLPFGVSLCVVARKNTLA